MTFEPYPRSTMLRASGPRHDAERMHLFVVLTEKCENGAHLCVPICSASSDSDRTCILLVGDHEFIKHESFVDYSFMVNLLSSHVAQKVASGEYIRKEDLIEPIFRKVCDGVSVSEFIKPSMKKMFQKRQAGTLETQS